MIAARGGREIAISGATGPPVDPPNLSVMSPAHKFVVDIAQAVESAFGILTQRFRIYHRKMCLLPETVLSVVKATVVLHNMLQAVSAQRAVFDFGANDEEELGHMVEV